MSRPILILRPSPDRAGKRFRLLWALLALLLVATPAAFAQGLGAPLQPGDIVVTDLGWCQYCVDPFTPGAKIFKVDPATGTHILITAEGELRFPAAVAINGAGRIFVLDDGRILALDAATGAQTLVTESAFLGSVWGVGITLDAGGNIIAGRSGELVRVDPDTGNLTVITSGGDLHIPLAIAVAPDGSIFVGTTTGYAGQAAILKVHPITGQQTIVSAMSPSYGYIGPVGMAFNGAGELLVTLNPYGVSGGLVVKVDTTTGSQTILSGPNNQPPFVFPWNLAVDHRGDVLVADSLGYFADGDWAKRIVRVNACSGAQTELSAGGGFVDPHGVAIMPGDGSPGTPSCPPSGVPAGEACVAPPAGLLAWYRAEADASDSVGPNHGLPQGGAAFASGAVGQAFDLSNFNSFIRVPDNDSLDTPDGLTVDAWIYPRSSNGPRVIASKWDDPTGQWSWIFKLHNDGSGHLRIELSAGGHTDLADLGGGTVIPLNTWSHVAATYDRAANRVRLYVNGVLDAEGGVFRPNTPINSSAADLLIGAVNGQVTSASEHFDGRIDELEIFARELSPQEMQAIYAAGTFGKCTNRPPTANPGEDATVACTSGAGALVTLDGSASSDPDGDELTYTWTGPFGSAAGVSPSVMLPLGASTVTLVVSDGTAGSEPVSVNISVEVTANGFGTPLAALVPEGDAAPLPPHAFKQGRTLPLKLQLSCSGTPMGSGDVAAPYIAALIRNGDALDLNTLDLDSGDANDSGANFRFDTTQWIHNLSTQGLATGTYTITIRLPDGRRLNGAFVLK